MAAAASALRPLARQAAPLLLVSLALAYAVAVILAVDSAFSARPVTNYAAVSAVARTSDLGAGLALLAGGIVAWSHAGNRWLGSLALVLGALWFGPDWEGWQGHAVGRSLGALAAPFFVGVLLHLVVAAPRGRLSRRTALAAVGAAYAVIATVAVGRVLFRDPFLDRYCWRNCADNVFLVHANQRIARDLDILWLGIAIAIGVLAVAIGSLRLRHVSRPALRALAPILVPAALLAAAEAAYAAALLQTPLEDPRSSEFQQLFLARSLAGVALGAGVFWSLGRARRARATVARLTAELDEAPPPGKLEEMLARAVGDPSLRVAYWLESSRRFVGVDGKRLPQPVPENGRAVTPIVRGRRPLALVTHDAVLVDGAGLQREIGSAARLAVENERLQAEVLSELEDLRSSRTRIVERADTERRRLERNLHDGAQQRLLALSYDLRLACAAAEAEGDLQLTALLKSAVDEAQRALEELRELAHGIYPAILSESGLGPALATLADDASVPVEFQTLPQERYNAPIEAAAYLVVAQAVDDAAARAASTIRVDMRRLAARLLIVVEDDGRARSATVGNVSDRIGALGGSLALGPTMLRASIPCE